MIHSTDDSTSCLFVFIASSTRYRRHTTAVGYHTSSQPWRTSFRANYRRKNETQRNLIFLFDPTRRVRRSFLCMVYPCRRFLVQEILHKASPQTFILFPQDRHYLPCSLPEAAARTKLFCRADEATQRAHVACEALMVVSCDVVRNLPIRWIEYTPGTILCRSFRLCLVVLFYTPRRVVGGSDDIATSMAVR